MTDTNVNAPLLEVAGLTAGYGKITALHGVSLQVMPARIVCVLGANGAGKTTLLRALSGLMEPTAGTVTFDGRRIEQLSAEALVPLGIAHVPQGRMVFGQLSVRDNLALGGYTRPAADVRNDMERVLGYFPRLKERLGHGGQQLSGGEQQMLTIGRALMTNPDVLILDEATEGLAPLIAREIWRICSVIKESGISSIIVDKNWKHVTKITDRNVILVKGEVVFQGSSELLQSQPEVLAQHLGV